MRFTLAGSAERKYFAENSNAEIPIFGKDKQPLAFCYCDKREYATIWNYLRGMERVESIPSPLTHLHKSIELICISDLNEYYDNLLCNITTKSLLCIMN